MNKKLLKELKIKLEKEKELLEKELRSFAEKDKKLKGNWKTKYPYFGEGVSTDRLEEGEADEVEEYSDLLPIEYSLETKLRDVNLALEKIKKHRYGICEKCKRPISVERLKICPEARICAECYK